MGATNENIEQLQISIQKQAQDQKYANFTMATMLSTAENIVWRICDGEENKNYLRNEYSKLEGYVKDKLIFEKYNSFESGKKKPINSLINQLLFQIYNFKDDYQVFKELYQKYIFPDNISKYQILQILDIWIDIIIKNNVNEMKKYFEDIKEIIEGVSEKDSESFLKDINGRINKLNLQKNAKVEPKILQKEYANAIRVIEEKTNDISHQNLDIWK